MILSNIYKIYAASNMWGMLLPQIILALGGVSLLFLERSVPRFISKLVYTAALLIHVLALSACIFQFNIDIAQNCMFSGMLVSMPKYNFILILLSLYVCYLAHIQFRSYHHFKTEFLSTLLIITAAFMIVLQSNHFILFFVALETATIGLYVLIAYGHQRNQAVKASTQYLILSSLSSAIMLFGGVLLWGTAHQLIGEGGSISNNCHLPFDAFRFTDLGYCIASNYNHIWLQVGSLLLLSGVLFKIAIVPFHVWVPRVYQSTNIAVMTYLAVVSKIAGFLIFVRLLTTAFHSLDFILIPILLVAAMLTILIGSIGGLAQENLKRLIAFSSIAHSGYTLLLIAACYRHEYLEQLTFFYLITYSLGVIGVNNVLIWLQSVNIQSSPSLYACKGLFEKAPFLATVLAISIGSLAGIPPMIGFIGKLVVFKSTYSQGLYSALTVSLFGAIISIYFYLNWIREAFFPQWKSKSNMNLSSKSSDILDKNPLGNIVLRPQDRLILILLITTIITGGYVINILNTFINF